MTNQIHKFCSIDQVPHELWDSIAPKDQVSIESSHLKAIEWSGINDIKPYYILATNNNKAEGIAHFFIMNMDFSGFGANISPSIRQTLKYWYPNFLTYKMIECGLISSVGETIVSNSVSEESFLKTVLQEMDNTAWDESVDFILIRDISYGKLQRVNYVLIEEGYMPVLGYPLAILDLNVDNFDEYIASLKSNSRSNILSHLARSDKPEISVEIIKDYSKYADILFDLSEQMSKRSDDYEHEKLTASYFYEMGRCLPERSFVIATKLYNEIVAFVLCLEGDNELFAAHGGVNYKYNQEYELYFNIYFQCIDEALKRKKKRINFGITTYGFKTLIGCELYPLVYYVKHCKDPKLTGALVKEFSDSIKQPDNYHRPFRNQDISKRVQLRSIEQEIKDITIKQKNDVFKKAYNYVRMDTLRFANLYSFFPSFESAQKEYVEYNQKRIIMLGSNSYLGLGSHPKICEAAKQAIDKYGTGCSGSPVLNGTLDIHKDLIRALADFMHKEDAIIFSTGYQANLGVVAAIAGRHDLLILDSLNHASIMDGAKFSYADVVRYEHDNMQDLERILKLYPNKNKFIVADSVFSMEGTLANIPELVRLAKKYGARLMLDEAHGIGVLGPGGRGAAEHFGLLDEVDIVMGTFSKSFAGVGGFVASDAEVIDYLRHVARPHIFSASLPPPVVATVRAALDIIVNEPERRLKLLDNAKFMAQGLQALGFQAEFRETAVVPVYCCDETLTMALFSKLFQEGVYVNPVISPAVPKGRELLRTSYMAIHDKEILADALEIFKKVRTPNFPVKKLDLAAELKRSNTKVETGQAV